VNLAFWTLTAVAFFAGLAAVFGVRAVLPPKTPWEECAAISVVLHAGWLFAIRRDRPPWTYLPAGLCCWLFSWAGLRAWSRALPAWEIALVTEAAAFGLAWIGAWRRPPSERSPADSTVHVPVPAQGPSPDTPGPRPWPRWWAPDPHRQALRAVASDARLDGLRVDVLHAQNNAALDAWRGRCGHEQERYSFLNSVHGAMERAFLTRLREIDPEHGEASQEVRDSLKQRALAELAAAMNRASKVEVPAARDEVRGAAR
jgi:hypothetical protein